MTGAMAQPVPPAVEHLIRQLPKVELHVHLEGSLPPALLLELSAKHQVSGVPRDLAAVRNWYEFRDFAHFVDVYRAAVRVLRDEDDFARLAETVLTGLAAQNVRYAEVTVSLHEHLVRGIPAAVCLRRAGGRPAGGSPDDRDRGALAAGLRR